MMGKNVKIYIFLSYFFILLLTFFFAIVPFTGTNQAEAVEVILSVVDQNGLEIPGSKICNTSIGEVNTV